MDQVDLYSPGGFASVTESANRINSKQKKYKLAFFQEGSAVLNNIENTMSELKVDGIKNLIFPVFIVTLTALVVMFFSSKIIARKSTR